MKVLVLGGVTYDKIVKVNDIRNIDKDTMMFAEDYFEMIGSTGSGKALSLKQLGMEPVLYALIGNDDKGDFAKNYFKDNNVDFIPILNNTITEQHVNIMHNINERLSIFTHIPNDDFEVDDVLLRKLIDECDIIILNILAYCKKFIPYLKDVNKDIIVDLHDYDGHNEYHKDFLDMANIVFISDVKLDNEDDFINNQIKNGKKLVVVTRGKDGASGVDDKGNKYNIDALSNINIVDTNGAGDNFTSGFIYGYYVLNDIDKAFKYGTVLGAITCESNEIFNGNYTKEDIERIVASI